MLVLFIKMVYAGIAIKQKWIIDLKDKSLESYCQKTFAKERDWRMRCFSIV